MMLAPLIHINIAVQAENIIDPKMNNPNNIGLVQFVWFVRVRMFNWMSNSRERKRKKRRRKERLFDHIYKSTTKKATFIRFDLFVIISPNNMLALCGFNSGQCHLILMGKRCLCHHFRLEITFRNLWNRSMTTTTTATTTTFFFKYIFRLCFWFLTFWECYQERCVCARVFSICRHA